MLASLEHQEINGQVEVTWRTLRTIAHSLMVHARVLESNINFALIYMADHIFAVLPIKYFTEEDGGPTASCKLATGTNLQYNIHMFYFCPCVVHKDTAHVGTKALNMRHQAQNVFCSIFVGITQHQKEYLVYVPNKRKILSLYNIVFNESFCVCFGVHFTAIFRSNVFKYGSVVRTI